MFCVFFKGVDFINNDESEDYKKFHYIRKIIVDEFVNYDARKLVKNLNLFDFLRLVIKNQDDDKLLDVDIDSLRENFFRFI